MPARTGKRVLGIGGIFFRAREPDRLSEWYRKHLGISVVDNFAVFTWLSPKNRNRKGQIVWSVFPKNSSYLGGKDRQLMINYRVRDLRGLLGKLRREGVDVAARVEESKYGKFGWVTDPEGNRIELWEPPKAYRPPEKEIPME